MAMAVSFTLMEIITLGIGLMESGLDMDGLSINLAGYMKANGSTVNLWVNDIELIHKNIKLYATV